MKKKALKLHLHRETLRSLDQDQLGKVAGGTVAESDCPSACIGCYPTIYTECISQCVVCPQDPPSYWC